MSTTAAKSSALVRQVLLSLQSSLTKGIRVTHICVNCEKPKTRPLQPAIKIVRESLPAKSLLLLPQLYGKQSPTERQLYTKVQSSFQFSHGNWPHQTVPRHFLVLANLPASSSMQQQIHVFPAISSSSFCHAPSRFIMNKISRLLHPAAASLHLRVHVHHMHANEGGKNFPRFELTKHRKMVRRGRQSTFFPVIYSDWPPPQQRCSSHLLTQTMLLLLSDGVIQFLGNK